MCVSKVFHDKISINNENVFEHAINYESYQNSAAISDHLKTFFPTYMYKKKMKYSTCCQNFQCNKYALIKSEKKSKNIQ